MGAKGATITKTSSKGAGTRLPTVSCVISTFNNSRTLRDCLCSVLAQDYPADLVEIVAADGGSEDGTIEILEEFGARIVHNPTVTEKGFEGGKNRAIRAASNDVLLIVDADNVLSTKTYLRELMQPFLTCQNVVAVSPVITASPAWTSFERYAGYVYDPFDHKFVLSCEERTLLQAPKPLPDYILLEPHPGEKIYVGNGTAVSRVAIIGVGGYDFDLEAGIRLSRAGSMYLSPRTRLFHHNATSIRQYIRKRLRGVDELMRFAQSRAGPDGFNGIVLPHERATALRLSYQVLANVSIFYPISVAVAGSLSQRDIAYLWHAVLAPLATVAYVAAVLRSRKGWSFLVAAVRTSSVHGKKPVDRT